MPIVISRPWVLIVPTTVRSARPAGVVAAVTGRVVAATVMRPARVSPARETHVCAGQKHQGNEKYARHPHFSYSMSL
jgi:hypothetical protein